MRTLRVLAAALLLPLVLAACQSTPTRGDNWNTLEDGEGAARLAGPDGVEVVGTHDDANDRAVERVRTGNVRTGIQRETVLLKQGPGKEPVRLEMAHRLGLAPSDVVVEENIEHPTRRPTVTVKYAGKPPKGFLTMDEQLSIYGHSRIEGDVVVYETDLAKMTMTLEKPRGYNGESGYAYREMHQIVPYGFCLDFINENLGKKDSKSGFILRKVECNQNGLGDTY